MYGDTYIVKSHGRKKKDFSFPKPHDPDLMGLDTTLLNRRGMRRSSKRCLLCREEKSN